MKDRENYFLLLLIRIVVFELYSIHEFVFYPRSI